MSKIDQDATFSTLDPSQKRALTGLADYARLAGHQA